MADVVNVAPGGAAGAGAAGAGGGAVPPLAAPTDVDFAAATEAIKVAGAQPGLIKSGKSVRVGCYLCGHTDTLPKFIREGGHGSRCTAYGANTLVSVANGLVVVGQHKSADDFAKAHQARMFTLLSSGAGGAPVPVPPPVPPPAAPVPVLAPAPPAAGAGGSGAGPVSVAGTHGLTDPTAVSQARALRRGEACRQLRLHVTPFARHVANGPAAPINPDTVRSWAVGFVLAIPGLAKGYPLVVALGLEAIWARLTETFDLLGVSDRLAQAKTEAGASPGDPTPNLGFIGDKHLTLMASASSILADLLEVLDKEDDLTAAPPRTAPGAIDLAGLPTLAEYAKLLCQQTVNRVFLGFEAPIPGLDVTPYHNALGSQLTVEVGSGSKPTTITFVLVKCGEAPRRLVSGAAAGEHQAASVRWFAPMGSFKLSGLPPAAVPGSVLGGRLGVDVMSAQRQALHAWINLCVAQYYAAVGDGREPDTQWSRGGIPSAIPPGLTALQTVRWLEATGHALRGLFDVSSDRDAGDTAAWFRAAAMGTDSNLPGFSRAYAAAAEVYNKALATAPGTQLSTYFDRQWTRVQGEEVPRAASAPVPTSTPRGSQGKKRGLEGLQGGGQRWPQSAGAGGSFPGYGGGGGASGFGGGSLSGALGAPGAGAGGSTVHGAPLTYGGHIAGPLTRPFPTPGGTAGPGGAGGAPRDSASFASGSFHSGAKRSPWPHGWCRDGAGAVLRNETCPRGGPGLCTYGHHPSKPEAEAALARARGGL